MHRKKGWDSHSRAVMAATRGWNGLWQGTGNKAVDIEPGLVRTMATRVVGMREQPLVPSLCHCVGPSSALWLPLCSAPTGWVHGRLISAMGKLGREFIDVISTINTTLSVIPSTARCAHVRKRLSGSGARSINWQLSD